MWNFLQAPMRYEWHIKMRCYGKPTIMTSHSSPGCMFQIQCIFTFAFILPPLFWPSLLCKDGLSHTHSHLTFEVNFWYHFWLILFNSLFKARRTWNAFDWQAISNNMVARILKAENIEILEVERSIYSALPLFILPSFHSLSNSPRLVLSEYCQKAVTIMQRLSLLSKISSVWALNIISLRELTDRICYAAYQRLQFHY